MLTAVERKFPRPPSLHGQIAEQLRAAIERGQFKPGEKLDSRALTATFGVCRRTLTEALRLLAADGLVVVRHGARPFVKA